MIVLRHCESEFNQLYSMTGRDPGTPDPSLSTQGKEHALRLVSELQGSVTRILVSPFTRTLQTAAPLAQALNITPEIMPLLRERNLYSCDAGSPASTLSKAWPGLDFSQLDEKWWSGHPESDHQLQDRVRQFKAFMRTQPDTSQTLVVSHWWFLLALSGDSLENGDWQHQSL
ncbi:histidine phosphatase family protein [Acetobacter thailandicus]|uniref:Phosphoglycerate mutase family protein n=1 Tax=Acetobacter thailandicus TaxID=1502842 RepID=A0ABT3QF14_9PROT|nr:histidine phosphatase family protein [Acetobacter thailandicus]MCX2563841.1 phosphoglycerate mutase family protein [Acetobacter thailandicus]NHN95085.1 histidine phosphatase family protein [Acetobacter thailandicus]